MQGPIKNVLAEELKNSLRMKKAYEKALRELPAGCLVSRSIRGRDYYYLVKRKGKKVSYFYRGKVSAGEIKRFDGVKKKRAQYRSLLSRVKRQIQFLRGALRGKEPI